MRYRIFFFCLLLSLFTNCTTHTKEQGPVSEGTVAAGGFRVYYEQKGSGAPLLLLHAGLQDHTMWEEQKAELSKKYRVITPDLPFHGKTTGTDTSILAQEVIRILLDSLHIEKTSLAGLSMGASVVQDFIIAYPERVNKVFLISAGINGFDKHFPIDSVSMQWWPKFSAALEGKDTARAALEFTKTWGEGMDSRSDSLTKPASRYVYQTTLQTLKQHKMQGWPNLRDDPPAMENIKNVQARVLVIHGDKDLPYIATASEYLEKNLPHAKRVLIKDVAHMLNMEKSAEVNRLMQDFLEGK